MQQQIRFCKSFDGTRIAYAVTGEGPPLVKAQHWLTHLEYEWQSPIWRPWISALSKRHRLVRMDARGCGLSDRGPETITFEAFVRDLEAVVDALGLERFALFGHSQGGAIGIEYAVRHAQRVSHFVLLGVPDGYEGSLTDYAALKEADAAMIGYGAFLTALLNFLILAFVIFLLVRAANRLIAKKQEAPASPSEVDLLTEIRDELRKKGSRQ